MMISCCVLLIPGLCHLCLVTSSMTIVRAKLDMNVPRKRKGFCGQHDKVQTECGIEHLALLCSTLKTTRDVENVCFKTILSESESNGIETH